MVAKSFFFNISAMVTIGLKPLEHIAVSSLVGEVSATLALYCGFCADVNDI